MAEPTLRSSPSQPETVRPLQAGTPGSQSAVLTPTSSRPTPETLAWLQAPTYTSGPRGPRPGRFPGVPGSLKGFRFPRCVLS